MASIQSIAFLISMLLASTGILFCLRAPGRWMPLTEARHRHAGKVSVPLIGGPVIALATLASFALVHQKFSLLLILSSAILLLGVLDDRFEFRASRKLPFEIAAAAVWVYSLSPEQLIFSSWPIPTEATRLFAIFWIVGLTNALNLTDGIDGLAASIAAACLAIIALAGTTSFHFEALLLLGAIAAFTPFNFSRKGKVYLGDAGSLFIGFSLACILSTTRWNGSAVSDGFVSILLVSYPQVDTIHSIFRRLMARRRPMDGDQDHIHHRLLGLGLSHAQSTLILTSFTALVAWGLVTTGRGQSSWVEFSVLASGVLLCLFLTLRLHASVRRIQLQWASSYLALKHGAEIANSLSLRVSISAEPLLEKIPRLTPEAVDDLVTSLPGYGDTLQALIGAPFFGNGAFHWNVPAPNETQFLFSLSAFLNERDFSTESVALVRTAPAANSDTTAVGY